MEDYCQEKYNNEKLLKLKAMQSKLRTTKKTSKKTNLRQPSNNNSTGCRIIQKTTERSISRTANKDTFTTIKFHSVANFKNQLLEEHIFETDEDITHCVNQLYVENQKLFYPIKEKLIGKNNIDALAITLSIVEDKFNACHNVELKVTEGIKDYYIEALERIDINGMYFISLDWLLSIVEGAPFNDSSENKPLKSLLYLVLQKFNDLGVSNPFTHPDVEMHVEFLEGEIEHVKTMEKAEQKQHKKDIDALKAELEWIQNGRYAKEKAIYKKINGYFSQFYSKVKPTSKDQERLLNWLVKCNKILSQVTDLDVMSYNEEEIDSNGYLRANEFIRFVWTSNPDEYLGHVISSIENDSMNASIGGFYTNTRISDKNPKALINMDYKKYYSLMSFQNEYNKRHNSRN